MLSTPGMNSFADGFPAKLLDGLRTARKLTGSGLSEETGVPTFRDAQTGLWSKSKPEELATPEAFLRNPKLVWEWIDVTLPPLRRLTARDARAPSTGRRKIPLLLESGFVFNRPTIYEPNSSADDDRF